MKYLVRELQNIGSFRDGEYIVADTLTGAKIKASKMQFFQGTVMVIEDETGEVLSRKVKNSWNDI